MKVLPFPGQESAIMMWESPILSMACMTPLPPGPGPMDIAGVGFTSGAAILIVASQVPTDFGVAPPDGKILYRAGWAFGNPDTWHWSSIILAVVAALVKGMTSA